MSSVVTKNTVVQQVDALSRLFRTGANKLGEKVSSFLARAGSVIRGVSS
jgi:hypothetical protein